MIDLTPLDVRKKREDFRKTLRGYDPEDVDTFLELVAERMEELVKDNLTLQERTDRLQEQVSSQMGRENAVQQALVTAQELRDDIRGQARQEADEILQRAEKEAALLRKEAEAEAERIVARARQQLEQRGEALEELERKRIRFLRSFRSLLERELDVVEVEEGRAPLEETPVELDFGGGRGAGPGSTTTPTRTTASTTPTAPAAPAAPVARPRAPDPFEPEVRAPAAEEPEPGAPAEDGPSEGSGSPAEGDRRAGDGAPSPAGGELHLVSDVTPEENRNRGGDTATPAPGAPLPEGESPASDEGSGDPAPEDGESSEEDDPKRWLSSLVERELNEKTDEDSWS